MNLDIATKEDLTQLAQMLKTELEAVKHLITGSTQTATAEWVKTRQALTILGCSAPNTLIKLRKNGKITGKKEPNGQWFYNVQSIKKYRES